MFAPVRLLPVCLFALASAALAGSTAEELNKILAELGKVNPVLDAQKARRLDARAAGLAVKAFHEGDCATAELVMGRGVANFRQCWSLPACRKQARRSPEAVHLMIEMVGRHAACLALGGKTEQAREVLRYGLDASRSTSQVALHAHDLAARLLDGKGPRRDALLSLLDGEIERNRQVQAEMDRDRVPDPSRSAARLNTGMLVARARALLPKGSLQALPLAKRALAQAERAGTAELLLALPALVSVHMNLGQEASARPHALRMAELEKKYRSGPVSHPIGVDGWFLRDRYPELFLTAAQKKAQAARNQKWEKDMDDLFGSMFDEKPAPKPKPKRQSLKERMEATKARLLRERARGGTSSSGR